MTKEDIIRMAKEAGFKDMAEAEYWHPLFKQFAVLVAAREREKFCSVLRQLHDSYSLQSDPSTIRQRGQA